MTNQKTVTTDFADYTDFKPSKSKMLNNPNYKITLSTSNLQHLASNFI